ncbi:MAG: complement resistance protein TraT [Nitrospira sp.]|nr:hypothetical protein [Candidatus Manganitrophaceae bacterium]HIL33845.1 hypothetical protein [Candidatus Manganitrophaceae bacterium]
MYSKTNRRTPSVKPLFSFGLIFSLLLGTFGCAAMQTSIAHRDLDVRTRMSDSIFLDPVSPAKRTIFISIRNSSDKDFDLSGVMGRIVSRGYMVVNDPEKAHYILQANILYVGKADPTAIEEAMRDGYGPFGGIIGGAVLGSAISRSRRGAVVGGVLGGAAELLIGSLTKNITFTTITDVEISERSAGPMRQESSTRLNQGGGTGSTTVRQESKTTTNRRKYRTRISSTANKVNLQFEEARPALEVGLVRALSGLF